MAAHVVRIDENMSVDVDKTGRDQPAFGGYRAQRFARGQCGCHRGDLAAGDADVHHAA